MDKREKVIKLWKQCFDDSDEFIRFYFTRKYRNENAMVCEDQGNAIAALQMLPYPMSWENTELQTSYISGACTAPEARNRGIMTQLLTESFRHMKTGGIALSTLIPAESWLFDYYRKQGYATVFNYSLETYKIPATLPLSAHALRIDQYENTITSRLYTYFNRQMHLRPCCIQHTPEDFSAIAEELYLNGGKLFLVYEHTPDEPAGMALAFPLQDKIRIQEWFYDTEDCRQMLLGSVAQTWHREEIECKTLPCGSSIHRYGMARIINVNFMLEHYATQHPDIVARFQVTDPQLPENNGIYHIEKGTCVKETFTSEKSTYLWDIPTLTAALLGTYPEHLPTDCALLFPRQTPYMNLMLD